MGQFIKNTASQRVQFAMVDTDAHTANTFDLVGTATNLTSADDTVL